MGPLKAGDLNQRVSVIRQTKVSDGYGNTLSNWTMLASGIPAKVAPMKGGEEVRSRRLIDRSPVEVWVRSNSQTRAIRHSDRLVNARTGVTLEIRDIANLDGRDIDLLITCEVVK